MMATKKLEDEVMDAIVPEEDVRKALDTVVAALRPLSSEQCSRVVRTVAVFFDVDLRRQP